MFLRRLGKRVEIQQKSTHQLLGNLPNLYSCQWFLSVKSLQNDETRPPNSINRAGGRLPSRRGDQKRRGPPHAWRRCISSGERRRHRRKQTTHEQLAAMEGLLPAAFHGFVALLNGCRTKWISDGIQFELHSNTWAGIGGLGQFRIQ